FNDFNFLKKNKFQFEENIAILFFNTTCAICELEAEQLMDKMPNFVDLIFVSTEHKDTILNFANKFRLYHKPGFYFAQMDTLLIKEKYKPRGLPAYILYQNDLLIESGKGLISTNQLQQAFQLNIE
ncbi:MAG: hypothetical protein PF541_13265, partial [Prolixibacteraceae bacterium]|nr:hypothetical protein [Prolixibacteraceae bacterium]